MTPSTARWWGFAGLVVFAGAMSFFLTDKWVGRLIIFVVMVGFPVGLVENSKTSND